MALKIEAEVKLSSEPCVVAWDNKLYIGSEDGSIQSFDANLSANASWPAHAVQPFALAAGGGFVYSASNDGGIRVWSPKGEKIAELPSSGADVGTLHVFGKNVYAGDEAGSVTIYENNTEKARYNVLEEVKDLGLSLPFLFTVRDLDVTVTEIKPGRFDDIIDSLLARNDSTQLKGSRRILQYKRTALLCFDVIGQPGNYDGVYRVSGDYLPTEESKQRFVTRHTMEGRAPLRVAGKHLLFTARSGNSIYLHDASVATTFKRMHEVKVSDMIITSISVSGDYAWTGGWDGCVRRWKISGDQLEPSGSLDVGACINGLVTCSSGNVYAILTGGRVVYIKCT